MAPPSINNNKSNNESIGNSKQRKAEVDTQPEDSKQDAAADIKPIATTNQKN